MGRFVVLVTAGIASGALLSDGPFEEFKGSGIRLFYWKQIICLVALSFGYLAVHLSENSYDCRYLTGTRMLYIFFYSF